MTVEKGAFTAPASPRVSLPFKLHLLSELVSAPHLAEATRSRPRSLMLSREFEQSHKRHRDAALQDWLGHQRGIEEPLLLHQVPHSLGNFQDVRLDSMLPRKSHRMHFQTAFQLKVVIIVRGWLLLATHAGLMSLQQQLQCTKFVRDIIATASSKAIQSLNEQGVSCMTWPMSFLTLQYNKSR